MHLFIHFMKIFETYPSFPIVKLNDQHFNRKNTENAYHINVFPVS